MDPGRAGRGTDPPEADLSPQGDGDRLVAAFGYFFAPIFSWVIYLFNLRRPGYRRYHAQQGIAFGLVVLVFGFLFALPGNRLLTAVAFVVPLVLEVFYAYKAYAASAPFTIPGVTKLTRRLFPNFPG
jgi:uncharacterized membrane protein